MIDLEKLDAFTDRVLTASGTKLAYFSMPENKERIRDAMREVLEDANTQGLSAIDVCAQAHNAVACMLFDLGIHSDDRAQKLLENLGEARMIHKDVLPWPSAVTKGQQWGTSLSLVANNVRSKTEMNVDHLKGWYIIENDGRMVGPYDSYRVATEQAKQLASIMPERKPYRVALAAVEQER